MLQHLEQALQEADAGGFHDEQLLRRANVSLYFSSSPTPHRSNDEIGAAVPMPLELRSETEDTRSALSRVDSFHGFSLDASDAMDPPQLQDGDHANTWDLFLDGKTPHGGPIAFPMKTPTSQASMPGFFPDELPSHDDPTAFSPTHIDKKVLVTDNDLKLDTATAHRSVYWEALMGTPRARTNKRGNPQKPSNHLRLLPRGEAVGIEVLPTRPRRALLSESRYSLYPRDCGSGEHEERMAMPARDHRLPVVSATHSLAPSVVPLVDEYWPRNTMPHDATSANCPLEAVQRRPSKRRPPPVETLTADEYAAIFRSGFKRRVRLTPAHQSVFPLENMTTPRRPGRSKRKIGIYTPEARRERLRRFHEKRKRRVFHKRTQYDCRQRLAQSCPRVKGRFVRKQPDVEGEKPVETTVSADDTAAVGSPVSPSGVA